MSNNSKHRFNIAFTISISILTIILIYIPTGHENPILTKNTHHVKAKVSSVNNDDLQHHSVVTVGTQDLKLVILKGDFKGDTVAAHNVMMGQKKLDKLFREGDKVLALLKTNAEQTKVISARADDFYRIQIEWILLALFAIFLVGFAGITGFKALLSFLFTALALWKLLIPMFLKGYSPIISAFGIVVLSTTAIILLINGFSKKGMVALSGSITGVGITTLLALIFGHFF